MKDRDVVTAIILNKNNDILLQKKSLDYKIVSGGPWCFFGGEIEEGESPEKAIKREIKEEIGFNIKEFKLFKIINYEHKDKCKGKIYNYIVHFNEDLSNISIKEGVGFAFFNYSELDSLNLMDWNLKILKDYFLKQ